MGTFEYAKTVIDLLIKKREVSTNELKKLIPEKRIYGILAVLQVVGFIERTRSKVTWVGGSVGKQIVIEGLIDSATTSPIEVKVVGLEPLKVKIKET